MWKSKGKDKCEEPTNAIDRPWWFPINMQSEPFRGTLWTKLWGSAVYGAKYQSQGTMVVGSKDHDAARYCWPDLDDGYWVAKKASGGTLLTGVVEWYVEQTP